MNEEIYLRISGLGIIMYSGHAVSHIAEGEDYFSKNYMNPDQVLQHIYNGSIVGFGTGSPGDFVLKFHTGYPPEDQVKISAFKLRLAIRVTDNTIVVRDLYDLMDWRSQHRENQVVAAPNGIYHLTLLGDVPDSGILGDHQQIQIYLSTLDRMPDLAFQGVPVFSE
jgi:hypothetical protein